MGRSHSHGRGEVTSELPDRSTLHTRRKYQGPRLGSVVSWCMEVWAAWSTGFALGHFIWLALPTADILDGGIERQCDTT